MWIVTVPSLPGCFTQGETREEALANAQEAIALHLEDSEPLPHHRVELVKVRVEA